MDQGQCAHLNPGSAALLQLKNDFGIILTNLRRRLEHVFRSENVCLTKFSKHVSCLDLSQLHTHLRPQINDPLYRSYHFQIYDWLMLSAADRTEVLEGRQPMGYFEKPYLKDEDLTNRFSPEVRDFSIKIRNDEDGRINVPNMAKRLDYELQKNKWTRTQFAFRVLREGTGALIADIINNPHYRQELEPIYQKIYTWCQKPREDRIFEVTSLPKVLQPEGTQPIVSQRRRTPDVEENPGLTEDQLRGCLMRYLAEPSYTNIHSREFRQYMLTLASRHLQQLLDTQPPVDQLESPEHVKTETNCLVFYLRHGSGNTLIDNYDQLVHDRLIPIAFMDGWNLNFGKLAYCIKYVLDSEGIDPDVFAEKIVGCSAAEFREFLTSSHTLKGISGEQVTPISVYLEMNCDERAAIWNILVEGAGDSGDVELFMLIRDYLVKDRKERMAMDC